MTETDVEGSSSDEIAPRSATLPSEFLIPDSGHPRFLICVFTSALFQSGFKKSGFDGSSDRKGVSNQITFDSYE